MLSSRAPNWLGYHEFVTPTLPSSPPFPVAEINSSVYFKSPFSSLLKPRQLTEYTVMNVEPIAEHERRTFAGQGALSKRVRQRERGIESNVAAIRWAGPDLVAVLAICGGGLRLTWM